MDRWKSPDDGHWRLARAVRCSVRLGCAVNAQMKRARLGTVKETGRPGCAVERVKPRSMRPEVLPCRNTTAVLSTDWVDFEHGYVLY